MKKIPDARKEKIQLLKDLYQGKVSVNDIMPGTAVIFFYENGIYILSSQTGELKLGEAEFEEYARRRPWQKTIVFRPAEGCDPLPDDDELPNPSCR